MANSKKQVVFTNEIIYERNISDRIWPNFLNAQLDDELKDAWKALKCYYLFTQQWYPDKSKDIKTKIRDIKLAIGKPSSVAQQHAMKQANAKAWEDIEDTWCEISNRLEAYGIFKRNFAKEPETEKDESAL